MVTAVVTVHFIAPFLLGLGYIHRVPDRWVGYAVPAIAVSAFLAVVFLFPWRQTVYVLTFLSQWLLVYVVGLPLGDWIGLETLLSAVLIVEVGLIAEPLTTMLVVPPALAFMAMQQGASSAWYITLPAVPPGDVVAFVSLNVVVATLVVLARMLHLRVLEARDVGTEKDGIIQKLVDANMEYQRYALEVEKTTVQHERERISREIHDTVGYAFTNQRMMLEASTVLFDRDPARLKELIRKAQTALNDGYAQVRTALKALRDVGPTSQSLDDRILQLARQFSSVSGVTVRYEAVGNRGTVPEELSQALFRSVQEGITNAFCHGQAHSVTVTLVRRDGALHLRVLDDGRGSDEVHEGLGITGMRERLRQFRGTVSYRTLSPGFVLEVEVPA